MKSSLFGYHDENISIKQLDIKSALSCYENKRSIWKTGLFLYLADKVTGMDQFYYDLNKFYIKISHKPARLDNYLTVEQVKELKQIIKKSDVGTNSINAEIVDLYESIQDLFSPFRRQNDSETQQKLNLI